LIHITVNKKKANIQNIVAALFTSLTMLARTSRELSENVLRLVITEYGCESFEQLARMSIACKYFHDTVSERIDSWRVTAERMRANDVTLTKTRANTVLHLQLKDMKGVTFCVMQFSRMGIQMEAHLCDAVSLIEAVSAKYGNGRGLQNARSKRSLRHNRMNQSQSQSQSHSQNQNRGPLQRKKKASIDAVRNKHEFIL
jgi:hypothetical protein